MRKKIIMLLAIVFLGILYLLAYDYNILRVKNIFMKGQLYSLDKNGNIEHSNTIINLKFQIDQHIALKERTLFEFFNIENKKIFEIIIYKRDHDFSYHLSAPYVKKVRQYDPYMKLFCDKGDPKCALTFAFSDYEPIYNIPQDIVSVRLDGNLIDFKTVIYNYDKEVDDNHMTYEYDNNHIKVCTQFDSFKYTEALRITTRINHQNPEQKVCTKEDMQGQCCELKTNTDKFSAISVLHWKGDWNKGYFKEYSIELK